MLTKRKVSQRKLRPLLTLKNAGFRLGNRIVFENTSWTYRTGEQWAVLGDNGSGKSLFADAVRGRLPLVQGELNYHFRAPVGLIPEEAIGHVSFEERKANAHELVVQSRWNSSEAAGALSTREWLSYERVMEINPFEVSRNRGHERQQFERRLQRAIRLLGISEFLNRNLISLSNGETQRVQLARALCRPLRLLILDEPFTGMDRERRAHFSTLLARLMRTGMRMMLVTTRAEDLPSEITHVVVVDDCRVMYAGTR